MNLSLTKPLAFLDIESTGLNVVNDRIVEIAVLKISPNGEKKSLVQRLNPTVPISAESEAIHGISQKDVENEPTFKEFAPKLKSFIDNSDLAGYNSNKFDIPMLMEEFLRAEIDFDLNSRKMIDVQNIFYKKEKRTLEAAMEFYCGRPLENAHSAMADVDATHQVLEAQLSKYKDLEGDASFLHDFSLMKRNVDLAGRIVKDEKDSEVFNFGKYKGQKVTEVFEKDPSYYSWMMNSDFPLETKKVLTAIKLRSKTSG